jgi:hypothetical protein
MSTFIYPSMVGNHRFLCHSPLVLPLLEIRSFDVNITLLKAILFYAEAPDFNIVRNNFVYIKTKHENKTRVCFAD